MKTNPFILLVVGSWFLAPLPACGGNSGTGLGGGAGSGGSGGSCPIVQLNQACVPCVQANCGAVVASALGSGWASEQFGGTCADMMACACACSDANCATQCMISASTACQEAKAQVDACTTQSCQTNCVLF